MFKSQCEQFEQSEQYEQFEQREQYEQREQFEQYKQCEQFEQFEQYEQSEQYEQYKQCEQFEQFVQLRQFLRVASDALAFSSEPQRSTDALLWFSSVIHCISKPPVLRLAGITSGSNKVCQQVPLSAFRLPV